MSASAATKSASAKGKKAATPAQLRAAAREELNVLFASAPRGSIAGEEEYVDFVRHVLAQLDVIGGGEFTEEVAYQAAHLTHLLYRQAFTQVQAELVAERAEHEEAERADREGEEEAPASVAEVEAEVAEVDELADDGMDVIEEVLPDPQTHAKRKVAPCPVCVPEHKSAAKVVVSRPKRTLPADKPAAVLSPKKKARTTQFAFLAPVWRPATAEPPASIHDYAPGANSGGRSCRSTKPELGEVHGGGLTRSY
ncbi:hypothetical protein ACG7TL_001778 [Trametes sanguinea]